MKFTIKAKPELCKTCRQSRVVQTDYGEDIYCGEGHPEMKVAGVKACSTYKPFTTVEAPWEYKDAAWELTIKGGKVGFAPPKKKVD